MESDFSTLYSELKLQPDCSIDEFKRAYRRRIAELHPDRASSQDSEKLLSELLALCSSALRFHRQHGRLPGQIPQLVAEQTSRVAMPAIAAAAPSPRADQPVRRTVMAAAVFILLLLVMMAIWGDTPPEQSSPGQPGVAGATR